MKWIPVLKFNLNFADAKDKHECIFYSETTHSWEMKKCTTSTNILWQIME